MSSSYGMGGSGGTLMNQEDAAKVNQYKSFLNLLEDPNSKDDIKLKTAQELNELFEVITQCQGYPLILEHMMRIFLKTLSEGNPLFIAEYHVQQVWKIS